MPPINLTAPQSQQIEDLRSYVQEYCRLNDIDPAIYTQALDAGTSIDPSVLNSDAFQAYWQLAYLQLMEIINPSLVQSLYSEVGDVNFDDLFSRAAQANPELNEFIRNLIADSPELMASVAASDIDATTDPQAVLRLILDQIPPPPGAVAPEGELPRAGEDGQEVDPLQFIDEGARAWKEEFELSDTWDWIIGTEEGNLSAQNYILNEMAKLDAEVAKIQDAIRGGSMSAESELNAITQNKQFLMGAMQNLQGNLNMILETLSKLFKSQSDLMQAISQNLRRA